MTSRTECMSVGNEVKPTARPPHMLAWDSDRPDQLLHLAHHFTPPDKLFSAPRRGIPDRETGAIDGQPLPLQPREPANQLVRSQFAPLDRRVDRAGVVVQATSSFVQQYPVFGPSVGLRPADRQCASQLVQNRALVGLVAVQLETRIAQVDGVEAALHDLQGGHLLRHEEDR